jgi:hypothetical protein
MRNDPHHKWLNEIMTGWIQSVRDPDLLDAWIAEMMQRKNQLGVIDDQDYLAKLRLQMKDWRHGQTIWVEDSLRCFAADGYHDKWPEDSLKWRETRFYVYQPRAKRLWLEVQFKTGRTPRGRDTTPLVLLDSDRQLLRFRPGRTELDVRKRNLARKRRA